MLAEITHSKEINVFFMKPYFLKALSFLFARPFMSRLLRVFTKGQRRPAGCESPSNVGKLIGQLQ